jgi:hypothetical protein
MRADRGVMIAYLPKEKIAITRTFTPAGRWREPREFQCQRRRVVPPDRVADVAIKQAHSENDPLIEH